jgi:processive 1,2-diacylglycerol beta-glucosyltransferase
MENELVPRERAADRERVDAIEPVRAPRAGEALRVLVTSGGFGVGPMERVVRSFAGVPDVTLTVVCGRATKLVERVTRIAGECGVDARVLGFERDMPARLAEAHVVVGKAGGLTISESMTAGRPLVIVGAVPGNEAINEAFVVGGQAGIACAPEDVGARVGALRSRSAIEAMGARAQALVMHEAADRVIDLASAWACRPHLAA